MIRLALGPRTILDPRISYTLRERIDKLGEWVATVVAALLPYRVRYWAYIGFAYEHMQDDDVFPEVRVFDVLQRAR